MIDVSMLEKIRKKLIKEFECLTDDDFNKIPSTGLWSIAQVCHHLVLVERSTQKAIAWGLKNGNSINTERKYIQSILNRTKKRSAPGIVEPADGPFEVQNMIEMLRESRNCLMDFLNTLEDISLLKEKVVKHPAFGELPLDQWLELIHLHEQRHIDQIKEIKIIINA